MYNSKPSSVSHKDGGDNSLIPAWSFLSLPGLLRLDLAHNLMTSSLHSAIWKAAHAIAGPEGLSGRPLSPLTHVRAAFQVWSAQLLAWLHPPPKSHWGSLIFFFFLLLKWSAACTCCMEDQFYTTHLLWNTLPEAITCIDPFFTKEVNSLI